MFRHFFLERFLFQCIFSLILKFVDVVGYLTVVLVGPGQRNFLLSSLLFRLQLEDRFMHICLYEIFLFPLVQLVDIT